jgi:hypothetical protein
MVVKRTAMGKRVWFFFTMFSTSGRQVLGDASPSRGHVYMA